VTARKDWEEAKRRRKAFQKKKAGSSVSSQDAAGALPSSISEPSNICDDDADDLRCILYAHGGGYYFGSLDQQRSLVLRSTLIIC
jgi:acetyl esterase/lipase